MPPDLTARTFAFESDFVAKLRCIPMAVRRKLDLAGVKLKLTHWNKLPLAVRSDLLERSAEGAAALAAWRQRVIAAVRDETGEVPAALALPPQPPWRAVHAPAAVRTRAAAQGVSLTDAAWAGLDELERFALCKLVGDGHESENFPLALREFGLQD